jgi:hypothetical protein
MVPVFEPELAAFENVRPGKADGLASEFLDGFDNLRIDFADNTSSTIFAVASSVTRWPWTNSAFNPAFSIARVMALPPPWTTTGLISTASRKTTSRATRCGRWHRANP